MSALIQIVLISCLIINGLCRLPEKPEKPDCNVDPVKNNPLCDILPPECRFPECGRDYNYKKAIWFGNGCYRNQYNKQCKTNFVKTGEALCDRNERPPPSLKPCQMKPIII